LPRGWEDYWGRVRRIQYPTAIYAVKEATDWYSYAVWGVMRSFERDLEFNIPTPYLQVRVQYTHRTHTKSTLSVEQSAYFRVAVYWNDVVKAYSPTYTVSWLAGYEACRYSSPTALDYKIGVVLDDYYWRGKVKIEFQSYVDKPDELEAQLTDALNKIEVGVYAW